MERNKNTTLYFYNSTEKGTEVGQAVDLPRIKGRYANGVVRVKLFPGQVEDSGQYVCAVISDGVYQEAIAQVIVAGFFDVEAEHDVITAVIGENAILPCRLITKHLPPSMELQWRKVGPGEVKTIYLYLYDESSLLVNSYPQDDKCSNGYLSPNGVNSREWLRKKYEKKAKVFKGKEFGKGNISLQLNNIQVEDAGKYVCSATANSFHREIITDVLVIEELQEETVSLTLSITQAISASAHAAHQRLYLSVLQEDLGTKGADWCLTLFIAVYCCDHLPFSRKMQKGTPGANGRLGQENKGTQGANGRVGKENERFGKENEGTPGEKGGTPGANGTTPGGKGRNGKDNKGTPGGNGRLGKENE
ncbi:uncharacterized protein LOC120388859 [Mauremys reevesii]|uniref:uncharacterized protein LOC120388859 n=1 Tax=Mauremys reevesii TaxID=260615 RepID=UPI00193F2D1E|nr:uncharacterized protein LOC120388859 [Mauremys reevesii]